MTDRQKVMSDLEGLTFDDWHMYHCDSDVRGIAIDALELLKQNEAKPVTYYINEYTGLPVATCPSCGKCLKQFQQSYDEETKFCSYCGQAVMWDG